MDLAVGVIIGAAVGKLIESMVKHIMMPLIGTVLPGEDSYLGWKWSIDGQEILYGQFIGELLDFLIVALVLFVFIVKFLGWVIRARTQPARTAISGGSGRSAARRSGTASSAASCSTS